MTAGRREHAGRQSEAERRRGGVHGGSRMGEMRSGRGYEGDHHYDHYWPYNSSRVAYGREAPQPPHKSRMLQSGSVYVGSRDAGTIPRAPERPGAV